MQRLLPLALCLAATPALAEFPVVEKVAAHRSGESWRFDVTLTHPDTGWEHYADGWEILAPDGTRLGFRELVHPHENEQPFTRSLSGVRIPAGVTEVTVRARCLVDGWAEQGVTYTLPQ